MNLESLILSKNTMLKIQNDSTFLMKYKNLKSLYFDFKIIDIPTKFCLKNPYIEYVYMPDSIISIGDYAFEGCSSLKYIKFSKNLKIIGKQAFSHCNSLSNINIPDSVVYIGDGCFSECMSLQYAILGKNINVIPANCFFYTPNLSNIVSYANYIGDRSFKKSNLNSFDFSKIYEIGKYAFEQNQNLISIELNNSISSIGNGCFHRCYNLLSATINANIAKIPEFMFKQCTNLHLVNIINPYISYSQCESFTECPNLSIITYTSKTFSHTNDSLDEHCKLIQKYEY